MPFPLTLALKLIVVVPELADVPVFRTLAVQVPVDVVEASACATNGDQPSSTDMVISAEGRPPMRKQAPGSSQQCNTYADGGKWRLRSLQAGALKSIQHWDPSLPPRIARLPGLPSRLLLDAQGIREVVPLGFE